jgi:hypothetical protein
MKRSAVFIQSVMEFTYQVKYESVLEPVPGSVVRTLVSKTSKISGRNFRTGCSSLD